MQLIFSGVHDSKNVMSILASRQLVSHLQTEESNDLKVTQFKGPIRVTYQLCGFEVP